MKPLLIAALALLLTPAAALAQVAAATVPNSFDRPATAASAPAQAAPAPVALPGPPTPANPRSEEVLRTLIGSAQSGAMDYALMTDDLATRIRAQAATTTPLIQGFGAIQAVDFVGVEQGADLYLVTFAHQTTQWIIGMNPDGKVGALLFRPAR